MVFIPNCLSREEGGREKEVNVFMYWEEVITYIRCGHYNKVVVSWIQSSTTLKLNGNGIKFRLIIHGIKH